MVYLWQTWYDRKNWLSISRARQYPRPYSATLKNKQTPWADLLSIFS